jgi:hypothetical protein
MSSLTREQKRKEGTQRKIIAGLNGLVVCFFVCLIATEYK